MFTGIIGAIGRIVSVRPLAQADNKGGLRLTVETGGLSLHDIKVGASIAIQGACLTIVELGKNHFDVEVSHATLDFTAGLNTEGEVNLEKSLCLGERVNGHLVAGHVDEVGEVLQYTPVGESRELTIRVPPVLTAYLTHKGSLAVNGVSLTINHVEDHSRGCDATINIIRHTQAVTTFRNLKVGDRVNLEVDTITRYLERILSKSNSIPSPR